MPVTAHSYQIILLGYSVYFFLLLYTTAPVTPKAEISSRAIQRIMLLLSLVCGASTIAPVLGLVSSGFSLSSIIVTVFLT